MEIVYLGRSAFRLRGKDVTIVTDPFAPSDSLSMGKPTADIVTSSGNDDTRSYLEGVGGQPRSISGPGEYEVSGVLIAGVATATEPGVGSINTAFVFRFDDLAVCHLGSARDTLSNQQIEAIGEVNVLLVPVGGGEALGAARAAEVIAQLEPQIIVPMHYRMDGIDADLEPVEGFVREMGTKEFVTEPRLSVSRGSLGQEVRIVVLESRRA